MAATTAAADVCEALTALASKVGVLARTQPVVDAVTLTRIEATQATQAATLTRIEATQATQAATLARVDMRSAVAYNSSCGDGAARAFVPVPNAAGVLPGVQFATAEQFMSLTAGQVGALAALYGVGVGMSTERRRVALKHALGLTFA